MYAARTFFPKARGSSISIVKYSCLRHAIASVARDSRRPYRSGIPGIPDAKKTLLGVQLLIISRRRWILKVDEYASVLRM